MYPTRRIGREEPTHERRAEPRLAAGETARSGEVTAGGPGGNPRPGGPSGPAFDGAGGERPASGDRDGPSRRIDTLNEALGGVVRVLADVATREDVEDAVGDLSRTALYDEVAFLGTVDRWRLPEADGDAGVLPRAADREALAWQDCRGVPSPLDGIDGMSGTARGAWALVPVSHGETPYGHLAFATAHREAFGERELATLERFGETLGGAIDALEDRRLLRAGTVTELAIECAEDGLAELARSAEAELSLEGLLPGADAVAFLRVAGGGAGRVVDAAAEIDGVETARAVDDGTVQLSVSRGSAVVALSRGGTTLRSVEAAGRTVRAVVEVAPETDVRAVLERIREHASDARLAAKRTRNRPPSTGGPGSREAENLLEELTDRQREVVEAAYRSGYFEWPRDRTAEEVAESMGISSATLHKHLRDAERSVLSSLFAGDRRSGADRERTPPTPGGTGD